MGFCHTSRRISHRYTHVPSLPDFPPPPSPPQPSACCRAPVWVPWVTQQIPTGHVFYIRYCKFPCYSLHLPFCLLSFHHVHRSVLHVCLSTAALRINSSVPSLQIPCICVSIWYLSFSFWLTSLCIICSSFVHLIRTDPDAFLSMAEWYCIVYIYHSFFIQSFVDGHLGCFHVLAIVNSASVNTEIHVSFSVLISSGHMPRSGVVGSYGGFIPSFLSSRHTVFHSGYIITFPPTMQEGSFPFLHIFSSIYCL